MRTPQPYHIFHPPPYTSTSMHFASVFGAIAGLLAAVDAVLVQDAFVKDWVQHNYGQFADYYLVNSALVAITDYTQLVSIGLSGNLNWAYDLRGLSAPVSEVAVTSLQKYAYATGGHTLYVWDVENGVLQFALKLQSEASKVADILDKGLLVLQQNGSLQLVDFNGNVSAVFSEDYVADFHASQHGTTAYVITDDQKVIAINGNGDWSVLDPLAAPFSKISDFKENVLVGANHINIITPGAVRTLDFDANLVNMRVVNSEYVVAHDANSLSVHRIVGDKLELKFSDTVVGISNVDSVSAGLSDFLVVSAGDQKYIYEITDFLSTDDASTIKKSSFVASSVSKVAVVFNEEEYGLDIVSTTLSDSILTITMLSMTDGSVTESSVDLYRPHPCPESKVLIVDKPQSESTINLAHHLLEESHLWNVFSRWTARTRRHLSELGRFVVTSISLRQFGGAQKLSIEEDKFGFGKLLIFYDDLKQAVVAVDSEDGSILWKAEIFAGNEKLIDIVHSGLLIYVIFEKSIIQIYLRNGIVVSNEQVIEPISSVLTIEPEKTEEEATEDPVDIVAVTFESSSEVKIISKTSVAVSEKYVIKRVDNAIQGYKVDASLLVPTFKFGIPNENIVSFAGRSENSVTASIGIGRFDKSVLYKYLNVNAVGVVTKDENGQLGFYLVDGITGDLLHAQKHADEVVDFESVNLVLDDNWVVYSYYVKSPKLEQRIVVIDFFDTVENAIGEKETSALMRNTAVDSLSSKSFVFPERILSLGSTQTKFGITVKSIVALTETGSLVEIPKYILNSRRIDDRAVTNNDLQDEFRMLAYEPIIPKNTYQVLNHKHKLALDDLSANNKIVVAPTELESTAVVCFVNKYNQFCTLAQPSLSYDLLPYSFDRVKLLITIAILLVAYVATKPFVYSKTLKQSWIDDRP